MLMATDQKQQKQVDSRNFSKCNTLPPWRYPLRWTDSDPHEIFTSPFRRYVTII